MAAVVNSPPAGGHSIIAFPERDFIHGDGWAQGDTLSVELFRGGVQVGLATGILPADDPKTVGVFDGLFDLNHLGVPCWSGATPDVLPGDVVHVTDQNGNTDETTVSDVEVTTGAAAQPAAGTVVMRGHAAAAGGAALSTAEVEARVISKGNLFSPEAGGKRDIRAPLVFDTGTANWTATWTGLSPADVDRAVNGESRVLWLGRAPGTVTALGSPIESTIFEYGVPAGAAPGCPAAVSYTVVGATPSTLTIANANDDLVLSGTSKDATSVTVSLTDGNGKTVAAPAAVPVPATGSQTWSATVPAADYATLADGTLTAAGSWSVPDPSNPATPFTLTGATRPITKDVVAPRPPAVSPAAGTYPTGQTVTLENPEGLPMRYTFGSGAPANPYNGQLRITSTQTLRAFTVDGVGNQSPVATYTFVIAPVPTSLPVPPRDTAHVAAAPHLGALTGGNGRLTVRWSAPVSDGGSAVTGYDVQTVLGSPGQVVSTRPAAAGARSIVLTGLVNGRGYRARVRAVNALGAGPWTGLSAQVVPATTPGQARVLLLARGQVTDNAVSVTARWAAPRSNGGAAVSGYRIKVVRKDGRTLTRTVGAAARSAKFSRLSTRTTYRFRVQAFNRAGAGPLSARSPWVNPR